MIINLKHFLIKKDCITYILFFTFVAMKKNKTQGNYCSNRTKNTKSFLSILKRFSVCKINSGFNLFQSLSEDNEKLQIIYANIRV